MTDRPFKDHFSDRSEGYARYRPRYPAELFRRLAELAPGRDLAWDCATGNGQAALGIARYFERVVATDASPSQIANADPHPRVTYRVGRESESGLDDRSADLITVAQAYHWLDADAFWEEARRVARPRGVVAVWMYLVTRLTPEIDRRIDTFYRDVVGPYWPPERTHIENEYRDLPFPLEPVALPEIAMEADWDLGAMCGYLRTWSGTRRFIADRGYDPVDELQGELAPLWGHGPRRVRWPLTVRAGRFGD